VIFDFYQRSHFLKSVTILVSGSSISYLIAFFLIPVITRIYSQEDLGIFFSLVSMVSIVTSFVNFRLDIAIPIVKSRREALKLFQVSLIMSFILLSPFTIAFYFGVESGGFGLADYPTWSPVFFFMLGMLNIIYTSLVALLHHEQQFGLSSRASVMNMSLRTTLQISFNFILKGVFALSLGELISRLLSSIYVWKASSLSRAGRRYLLYWHSPILVMKQNRKYLTYVAPASLMLAISTSMVVPAVMGLYGSVMAGQYAIAATVALVPITVLGKSISDVYSRLFSLEYHAAVTRNMSRLFNKTLAIVLLLSALIYGGLALLSETLFPLVFGPNWSVAGQLCSYLALSYVLYLPVMVLEKSCFLFGRESIKLIYDSLLVLTLIVIFYLASDYGWGIEYVVVLLSLFRAAIALAELIHINLIVRHGVNQINAEKIECKSNCP
jgi:O-antigen/teichoic acid export membrane protein